MEKEGGPLSPSPSPSPSPTLSPSVSYHPDMNEESEFEQMVCLCA